MNCVKDYKFSDLKTKKEKETVFDTELMIKPTDMSQKYWKTNSVQSTSLVACLTRYKVNCVSCKKKKKKTIHAVYIVFTGLED